jgi:hypothetical protein
LALHHYRVHPRDFERFTVDEARRLARQLDALQREAGKDG